MRPRYEASASAATFGVVEQGVDTLGAAAVDQRLKIPGDVGGGAVGFGGVGGGGHVPTVRGASPNASGSGSACTTTSRRVARVSTT